MDSDSQFTIYSVFFALIATSLPIVNAIFSGLIVEGEYKANGFQNILGTPFSKSKLLFSKIVLLVLFEAFYIFISTFILCLGMNIVLDLSIINYNLFLVGALLLFITFLFVLVFQLLVSFKWGSGQCFAVGVAGVLMAVIIGSTALGDQVWYFFPWAWPNRFTQYFAMIRAIGDPNSILSRELIFGGIAFVILTISIIVIGSIWFKKWNGRSQE